jgi:hypothetical protein
LRVSLKKRGEFSSSEDYFSCVYDSYVWKLDDDMITNLIEDDSVAAFSGLFSVIPWDL